MGCEIEPKLAPLEMVSTVPPMIVDTAAMVLPDVLTILSEPLTSVTSTVEKKRYDSTTAAAAAPDTSNAAADAARSSSPSWCSPSSLRL